MRGNKKGYLVVLRGSGPRKGRKAGGAGGAWEETRREEKMSLVTAGCDRRGLDTSTSCCNHHHPQAKPLHISSEIQLFSKVNVLKHNPS